MNLAWRWFLGYELDEALPDHCVPDEGPSPFRGPGNESSVGAQSWGSCAHAPSTALAQAQWANEEMVLAINQARQVVRLESYYESGYLRLIKLLAQRGDRAEALPRGGGASAAPASGRPIECWLFAIKRGAVCRMKSPGAMRST